MQYVVGLDRWLASAFSQNLGSAQSVDAPSVERTQNFHSFSLLYYLKACCEQ